MRFLLLVCYVIFGSGAYKNDYGKKSDMWKLVYKNEIWLTYIFLFIYLWLCWVFVSVRGLSLVAVSGGHSSSRCAGLSLSRPLLLRSTGSRRAGSVVVAHGPSCSAACGILPDQGSNPCPLHWQADSQPLRHQGSWLTYLICCVLGILRYYAIIWYFPKCMKHGLYI